jgi:hypothetical protein
MTRKKWIVPSIVLMASVLLAITVVAGPLTQQPEPQSSADVQAALGAGFTYQGKLNDGSGPITDDCDMAFRLYDQGGTGGSQIGTAISTTVAITEGLFTVVLNNGSEFGSTAFAGDARWLGILVKCSTDSVYADLGRQELTAAPYALHALSTGALQGYPISTTAPVATGQVLEWDGSEWGPASDDDTTYTAGAGLDLTSEQFSVVTSTIQARVNGLCAVGSTIRAITADGTVVCQVDAPLNRSNPPAGNTITTLNNTVEVAELLVVAIGADGLGLISYADVTTPGAELGVAHCNDLACTSATFTTLDSSGNVGPGSSIAIGADGLGLISYRGGGGTTLKVAHCDNIICTSAISATLDTGIVFGSHSSIMVGADGLGIIAYGDTSSGALKVAHCDDIACTSAVTTTLDSAGNIGARGTQMAIGVDGLGLISYEEMNGDDLRVAHCNDLACTSAITTTLDSAASNLSVCSIVIGADGLGLIMYAADANLKVAHCDNLACTSATVTTLDSVGTIRWPSVTIGADGLGITCYTDDANNIQKVAHCSDVTCSNVTITVLDNLPSGSSDRPNLSITIGVDGLPLIGYMDSTNNNLRVAHCSNPFCAPYFQRR